MSLVDRFLNRLSDHWEKKCKKEFDGIPLLWVIHQPQKPIPNILFSLHPMFNSDEQLKQHCKTMAEYMRANYAELREGESP